MPTIIGVDCDEVLSETIDELLKTPFFVEKGIQKTDITSYNLRELPKLGISLAEATSLFWALFASEQFWQIQPVKGAKEKLTQRKEEGHQLVVVTGRDTQFKQRTLQWIQQYFPTLFDEVLFANELTNQMIPKSTLCQQRGIQLMIEDRAPTVFELAQHGIPCWIFTKPRNQDETFDGNS
ncbi:MAG: hypothetical protein LBU27_08705 [Candidatus Peribacteria bacterium]|jgi:uncharacterized HAD superfamily protein|nr:hypothetical protein [Candidatus Peribacteria bacterium]